MPHNQSFSRPKFLISGIFLIIIGGAVALMLVDIPAPQQPVEKVLDAKTFLRSK